MTNDLERKVKELMVEINANTQLIRFHNNNRKSDINRLKQLVPMEWQQNHNTKKIVKIKKAILGHLEGHLRVYEIIEDDKPVDVLWKSDLKKQIKNLSSENEKPEDEHQESDVGSDSKTSELIDIPYSMCDRITPKYETPKSVRWLNRFFKIVLDETRVWCTKCDVNMDYEGIAFDHPSDGDIFICPKCETKIVLFRGEINN